MVEENQHVTRSFSTQEFEVSPFQSRDAAGIVHLFRRLYGEHYPIKLFYDAEALKDANPAGRYYSLVARTPDGEVIGLENLFRSAPYPHLYEAGVGLAQKEYRKLGINSRLLHFLYEEFIPHQSESEEVYGEAVCNHIFQQRLVERCQGGSGGGKQ
jgi:hypothetical protein